MRNCYERQLLSDADLAGEVVLKWTITPEGKTDGITVTDSTLGNAEVEACLTRVMKRVRFAKPEGEGCTVTYPVTLRALNSVPMV